MKAESLVLSSLAVLRWWMVKNPLLFVVAVGMVIVFQPDLFSLSGASRGYNLAFFLILAATLWLANFAEAVAEGWGKARAETLHRAWAEMMARFLMKDGAIRMIPSSGVFGRGWRMSEQMWPIRWQRSKGDRQC